MSCRCGSNARGRYGQLVCLFPENAAQFSRTKLAFIGLVVVDRTDCNRSIDFNVRVAILLATFRGEQFLSPQLESLAAQKGVDCTLLWRDDGSNDGTVKILEAFAARMPLGWVRRLYDPVSRLGAAGSFWALLAAAPEDAAFFAFCDQDDVWLPDKLARAALALSTLPPGAPGLYCGRQAIVGKNLEPLGMSPDLCRPPSFANALAQNIATGCTVVLNAAARRLLIAAPAPPAGSFHDWWCYLLITGAGGHVVWDSEPQILYRQHFLNTVGAAPSAISRSLRALRRGPDTFLCLLDAHVAALDQASCLSPKARETLARLGQLYGPNPLQRLAALWRSGLYRQEFLEGLILYLWIILRRPPKI
jgi:hypothetical protein